MTQESDCKLEVSDNGGPFKQLKCPPGTVISVARATWDEVSNIENDVVVSLSGQQKRDDEQIDQAVDELVASIAPVAVQQANCNEKDRSVHGSYNIGGSYRVEYALKYHIKDSCEVRKIRDKARTNAAASEKALWLRSCSRSSQQCKDRNATLSTGYTNGTRLPNSDIGREYRNISRNLDCVLFCVDYYGNWFFD